MLLAAWLFLLTLRIVWWPFGRYGLVRGTAVWTVVLVVAIRLQSA